ncbi:pollen-specific protein C13-like [Impatiens glandulifera]|uniref:pollen-specific protein C13-like n=1 Tax=Impatiens glandulifera TaxID=253017 RepID=UPI001FB08346|nr:pollen-specific protein C13-like [Impatiens glandulifera]
MARLMVLMLVAVYLLPAIVTGSRPMENPLTLEGRVYCDTCRLGFETSATTYISGAKVKVECKNRNTHELMYTKEATTDQTGTYKMTVNDDHQDQICDVMLVSSPQNDCAKVSEGRDHARVVLSQSNGIASDKRYANAMGFVKDQAMEICNKLLEQYNEDD